MEYHKVTLCRSSIDKLSQTETCTSTTPTIVQDIDIQTEKEEMEEGVEMEKREGANKDKDENETNENRKKESGSLMKVFSFGTPWDRGLQTIGAIAAIGAGAALPLMNLVFGKLVNVVTQFDPRTGSPQEQFRQQINHYTLWFVYLFVGKLVLVYIHTTIFTITADRMVKALRLRHVQALLSQDISYFEDGDSSGVAGSIITNSDSIQAGVADKFGSAIQAAAMFVAAFAIAFTQQWKLTLVTASILPGIMILMGVTAGLDTKVEGSILEIYQSCGSLAEEVMSSMKTVIAYDAAEKVADQYNLLLKKAEIKGRKKGPLMGLMFSSQFFFMLSGYALSFWFGLRLYRSGEINNPGVIITVFFSVLLSLSSLMSVGPNMPTFGKASAAATAVFAILNEETTDTVHGEVRSTDHGPPCRGSISFQDVSFSYPSRPSIKVLANAYVDFPSKSVTAIVGPSGSGKSTILALLERWFDPTEGQILLDGYNTKYCDLHWLRSQIAFVQQEPQLFNTTIFENVSYGLTGTEYEHAPYEIKLELVKDACYQANAFDFIQRLPNGFDTVVGDRASLLSGGQKQRIAIARAIIGRRPILLLDEATSALDSKSEATIESLSYASLDRTTIIVSHRLSTVKQADNIIVIDKGEVVEQGTHDMLLQLNGTYSNLVKAQDLFIDTEDNISEKYNWLKPLESVGQSFELSIDPDQDYHTSDLNWDEEEIRMTNPDRKSLLHLLFRIGWEQKRHWLIFCIGFIACIAGGGIFPVQAILFSKLVTVFQLPLAQTIHDGNFWALMFFVAAFGALFAYATLGFFMTLFGTTLTRFYRHEYFRAILRQDLSFFDVNASGALAARLSKDPSDLHELISVKLGLIITVFVNLIGSIAIAIAFGWKLALVTVFGALPFIFTAGYLRLMLDSALSAANAKLFEESTRFASEAVSAIRTVKSLTLESVIYSSYNERLAQPMKKAFRRTFVIMIFFALSESLELLAMALGFWYGGRLMSTGEYTAGQFFVVFIAIVMGGQAAGFMFGFSSNFNKARAAANNIFNLREQVPQINKSIEWTAEVEAKNTDVAVDFRNVSFAYPTRSGQAVLRNLNLQVRTGQTVALVGASGCGKTTVISLLERFYDIDSGKLLIDGELLCNLDIREHRKRISLVSQEPTLYRGTIRDNILFGISDPDSISESQFIQACQAANIHTFVSSLPEGYDTECGPLGVGLSGGQRQRVAIARALIRDPEILLLDEATSALDTESEKMVQESLAIASQNRTTIIVAHRLSTIQHADLICVFENGRIVERGTHSELVARKQRYWRMCTAQAVSS